MNIIVKRIEEEDNLEIKVNSKRQKWMQIIGVILIIFVINSSWSMGLEYHIILLPNVIIDYKATANI